jgi:hypothetical protein
VNVRRYTIEVDEEVFSYLEERAKARLETHNTVLHRELLKNGWVSVLPVISDTVHTPGRKRVNGEAPTLTGLPSLPFDTPAALQQVLWVTHLVRKNGRARSDASADVAKRLRVAPQTVNDKYCRQLGLTANGFDKLLRDPVLTELEQMLSQRFPRYRSTVKGVLKDLRISPSDG